MPRQREPRLEDMSFEEYAAMWGCGSTLDGIMFYNFSEEGHDTAFLKNFLPAIERTLKFAREERKPRGDIADLKDLKAEVERRLKSPSTAAESDQKSFSMGMTPKAVILKALKNDLGEKPYHISAVKPDADLIKKMVNQGIDGHLEALTESKFEWTGSRLECHISHKDLLVLLRRLYEDGGDKAWLLRTDILSTLEIEEI